MNIEELVAWKSGVSEHMDALDILLNDRKILKKHIEDHLKSCFQWDTIEYNRDFSEITLKWDAGHSPIIFHENIVNLNMDWEINAGYDGGANRIVIITVYPFGVPDFKFSDVGDD